MKTCPSAIVVTDSTISWNDDNWYVVDGDVTVMSRITVTGEVHLILTDGTALTASEGITVPEGNSLTIYAQSENENDMGSLTAQGTSACAGIGGTEASANGGDITINGGRIESTGGEDAAGIGGGKSGVGGTIHIRGGMVTATGKFGSAGIGGNCGGSGTSAMARSLSAEES